MGPIFHQVPLRYILKNGGGPSKKMKNWNRESKWEGSYSTAPMCCCTPCRWSVCRCAGLSVGRRAWAAGLRANSRHSHIAPSPHTGKSDRNR